MAFNVLKADTPTLTHGKEEPVEGLERSANNSISSSNILDQNSWEDLNLFFNKSGANHCLAEVINRATTEVGRVTLYRMLAQPTADIAELKKRQAIIRELVENEPLFDALNNAAYLVRQHENLVLAFWDADALKGASRNLYYDIDGVRYLNDSEYALAFKHLSDNAQRLTFLATNIAATVILPLYTLRKSLNWRNKGFDELSQKLMGISGPVSAFGSMIENNWVQGVISLGSAACCGLWAMGIYDWQRGSMALTNVLHTRMKHTLEFIRALDKAGYGRTQIAYLKYPAVAQLQQFFADDAQHLLWRQKPTCHTSKAIKAWKSYCCWWENMIYIPLHEE